MANTKTHPGLLGAVHELFAPVAHLVGFTESRADPAALEFWAQERNRLGKTTNPDDNARIGAYTVPGIDKPQTMEQIAATYRKAAESVSKAPTLDSQPEDLAHAPEVPHHRFSVFHTSGDYAYARGLEVSPMHLATALDAMAKSGWNLCAIFGQTDAQHIGFIFRRSTPVLVPSRFGDVWPPAPARESPSELLRAYQEGRSFEEIAKEECPDGDEDCLRRIGLGRGLTP